MQVDPRYVQNLGSEISASSASMQTLTSELSSGLRVATLSDDPLAASANVLLAGNLSSLDSFVQTATTEQGRLQATDSTLGEVVAQITSAISLATQAGDGTLNSSNLESIANQVAAIRDSIVSLANASYQGTYLFSGSHGETQPFTNDIATNPATATYLGDQVTSHLITPGGQSLPVNLPGSAVFLSPGTGVLGTLNQLTYDLQSGATAALSTDAANLSDALTNVDLQRSVLGTSLKQIESASTYAQTQAANIQAQQSSLLAADPAQVATSLQTAEVQHQAMISVVSSLSQNDLFSYLK